MPHLQVLGLVLSAGVPTDTLGGRTATLGCHGYYGVGASWGASMLLALGSQKVCERCIGGLCIQGQEPP